MARLIKSSSDDILRGKVYERLLQMGFDEYKSSRSAGLIIDAFSKDTLQGSRDLEAVLRYEGISASQLDLVTLVRG